MSKRKNRLAIKNLTIDTSAKSDSLSTQKNIDTHDVNSPGTPKKEISGIWPLIIFLSLLTLIFILGLLTT